MNLRSIVEALADYTVVLQPDRDVPEWWAGAPSVAVSPDGVFYLAARMREGDSPRGKRGYEIRILRSTDGLHFTPIHHIRREDVGVSGFERPALLWDHGTGAYRLYTCTGLQQGWVILRFDDSPDPGGFRPTTARTVLSASYPDDGFVHVTGYKDPIVFHDQRIWHMFVIAIDRVERIRHFVSDTGDDWQPASAGPVMPNDGWHNFFTRPASVLPLSVGYLIVYEGSNLEWRDPVYNIATGLAYSPDLSSYFDLTPASPLLTSTTARDYHTWRYSAWVPRQGRIFVYFEAARPNNTNELRVAVLEPELTGTE
ncbi:MAG: hypothetical protein GX620_05925 [Chloroflexi bacterium]|nr:hypothetical protein [Chloroflexota bacterium]